MNDQHMTLLLHGDSFTDKSMYQQAVTNINCTIADNFGKFGNKSFYFDGVNSRLQLPNLIAGSQEFTIDLWFYGVQQKNNTIWSHGGTNTQMGTGGGVEFFGDLSVIYYCNGFLISGMPQVSLNTWHHLAITGNGTSVTLFVDGNLYGTVNGYAYTFSNTFESIGANDSAYGVENFAGYMDEIRFSDTVRWTSNFTPPTEPYPDAEPGTYISKVEVNGRTLIDLTADTVDDNAVLSGITFHKKSGEIATGTIPSLGEQTISPTTSAQIISSGQYLSGNQTISAITKELLATLDSDFVAENIKKDVELFGLVGSFAGGGGGSKVAYGVFTVAEQVSSVQITHGLGVAPDFVFVYLVNPRANDSNTVSYQLGYSAQFDYDWYLNTDVPQYSQGGVTFRYGQQLYGMKNSLYSSSAYVREGQSPSGATGPIVNATNNTFDVRARAYEAALGAGTSYLWVAAKF